MGPCLFNQFKMLSRHCVKNASRYRCVQQLFVSVRAGKFARFKVPLRCYSNPTRSGYKPVEFKPPTLDDLPKFKGPWLEVYSAQQSKYNRQLVLSIAFIAGTVAYVAASDILEFGNPPPMKNPPNNAEQPKSPSTGKMVGGTAQPAAHTMIPDMVPYLLIGAGTASFAAFRAIRAIDPTAKVLLIGDEDHKPYMRPPLSKELWLVDDAAKSLRFKQWNGKERSIFFEHEDFYCRPEELDDRENGGVAVLHNCRVTRIDADLQKAFLEDGREIRYGKCLIATGGQPKNLAVFEKKPELATHLTLFRGVDDFKSLEEISRKSKSIAIVGGGFLGSELACALGSRSKKSNLTVYQVFPEKGNMGRVLPEYLAQWTAEKVRKEGVIVLSETKVSEADLVNGNQVKLTLDNGKELISDHVVVAVGVHPDTSLAVASGLEEDDRLGGFKANAELEVRTNVWVAGDALSFYDTKLGRRRVEHHDHAVVTGRLAGENMMGARKPYKHQSMFWSDIGPEVGYEAIGLVDAELPTVGVFAKEAHHDVATSAVQATGGETKDELPRPPEKNDDFSKGVVFYLRNDGYVVGIVLWNVFNRMPVARKIINEHMQYPDFGELAKLFDIHAEE
ncbi:apoptosis-inducing factor 1, mitochondrial-like [Ornithodoros turicata]|uniref:apoptosis-inducing factor 1, mitochondrial-like n=1 Tax=Ornithodoros turicata TaxID=34597 RepID=UPI003139E625